MKKQLLKDFTPQLFISLKTYDKEKFMRDLMAGLIVGIVALPLALAFGIASGVTPEQGIITAIIVDSSYPFSVVVEFRLEALQGLLL